MSDQGQNVPQKGTETAQENSQKPAYVLVFRLLIGVFLLWGGLFTAGFAAEGPGREKYFLLIFTLVFIAMGILTIISTLKSHFRRR